jgi:hypothetical protein
MSAFKSSNEVMKIVREKKKGLKNQVMKTLEMTISTLEQSVVLLSEYSKNFCRAHAAILFICRQSIDIRQVAIYVSQYAHFRKILLGEAQFLLVGELVLDSHRSRSFGFIQQRPIQEGGRTSELDFTLCSVHGLDHEYTEHVGNVKVFQVK